jgi:drug/metabolite transporter (DMT)-like permease
VLVAIVGRIALDEQISVKRWAGIALIVGGVALVSGSAPRSEQPKAKAAGAGQ